MIGMAVWIEPSAVGNGDMSEENHSLHIRLCRPHQSYLVPYLLRAAVSGYISGLHTPSIADKIHLKAGNLVCKGFAESILHNQHQAAPAVDRFPWPEHRGDIAIGVNLCVNDDAVFIDLSLLYIVV